MRKTFTKICLLLVSSIFQYESVHAQCVVIDSINSVYQFNNPGGPGTYSGFLCLGTDSLGTTGASGYYDGDGYRVKLVAGSTVTFSVDSCSGNPVSLTVNDSSSNIIPGAFATAACPNLLDFTAPYTGSYIIVINLNGICAGGGTTLLGEVHVKIKTGTTVPDCPNASVINDTICGAIPLHIDSAFVEGNTSSAFPTDPLDNYIDSIGGTVCSPPNNTLWYSFTAPMTIDTTYVVLTSEVGGNFHSWLVVFPANNIVDPCNGTLSFLGCVEGPNDPAGIDTVMIPVFGLLAGHTYFFMIDGYNGATGRFSIALSSSDIINGIETLKSSDDLIIYPNPASQKITISSSTLLSSEVLIFDSFGKEVKNRKLHSLSHAEIDISNLLPGAYIVRISSPQSSAWRRLVVTY